MRSAAHHNLEDRERLHYRSREPELKRSLVDVFPHPLLRGGGGSIPEQLHTIVAVCAACPGAHALIAAESNCELSVSVSPQSTSKQHFNNILALAPDGPRYINFTITEATTREETCDFIAKAEINASLQQGSGGGGSGSGGGGGGSSKRHARQVSAVSSEGETPVGSEPEDSGVTAKGGTTHKSSRSPVVLVVHDVHYASPTVLSALLDVMCFGQVQTMTASGTYSVRRVHRLRLVALCDDDSLPYLPPYFRAAFLLSLWVPHEVLAGRSNLARTDLLNTQCFQDLLDSPHNVADNELVYLHTATERHLRQCLGVLRGTMAPFRSTAAHCMRKVGDMLRVLKVVALLFSSESTLRSNDRVLCTPTDAACLISHLVAHLVTLRSSDVERSGETGLNAPKPGAYIVSGDWDALSVQQRSTGQDDLVPFTAAAALVVDTMRTRGPQPPG